MYSSVIVEFVTTTEAIPVGHGLYYFTFSTWMGKSLYLEDIYLIPKHRSKYSSFFRYIIMKMFYRQEIRDISDERVGQGVVIVYVVDLP